MVLALICPRCGEPWDFDTLHEEAECRYEEAHGTPFKAAYAVSRDRARQEYDTLFRSVSSEFRSAGCRALHHIRGSDEPCEEVDSLAAASARVTYEAMGDDLDGAAAMLDDMKGL